MTARLPITPETKVGALLEAYPELEKVLVAQAPAFEKLRNPVLRRTVGRVATLAAAAKIGGVEVRDLVRVLRAGAGLDDVSEALSGAPAGAQAQDDGPVPDWARQGTIRRTIDADALLASGRNPLQAVLPEALDLPPLEVLCLRATFRPEPLIELLRSKSFQVHSAQVGGGYEVFVRKG